MWKELKVFISEFHEILLSFTVSDSFAPPKPYT